MRVLHRETPSSLYRNRKIVRVTAMGVHVGDLMGNDVTSFAKRKDGVLVRCESAEDVTRRVTPLSRDIIESFYDPDGPMFVQNPARAVHQLHLCPFDVDLHDVNASDVAFGTILVQRCRWYCYFAQPRAREQRRAKARDCLGSSRRD